MTRLPKFHIVFVLLGLSANLYAKQPCDTDQGVVEQAPLQFIWANTESTQSALVTASWEKLSSWLEVQYSSTSLILNNRMPGLGIPVSIFHVRMEVFDEFGRELEHLRMDSPPENECQDLSLFPGQRSRIFEFAPDTQNLEESSYRVRVRLWTSRL